MLSRGFPTFERMAIKSIRSNAQVEFMNSYRSVSSSTVHRSEKVETTSPPPEKASAWYRLSESLKDIVAVTYGFTRQRNIEYEYDTGMREYPWVCYTDPTTDKVIYYNRESKQSTEFKPADFDKRATEKSFLKVNTEQGGLTLTPEDRSKWDESVRAILESPLMKAAKESTLGKVAVSARESLKDATSEMRDSWANTQHPLLVAGGTVIDKVVVESEQAKAIKAIQASDAAFDEHSFLSEMKEAFLPNLFRAFLQVNMPVLQEMCLEGAMAAVNVHKAALDAGGLVQDGTILNLARVEILSAKAVDVDHPTIHLSGMLQYIHCVRDSKGEIVDGNEGNVVASVFVVGITRVTDEKTGELKWKATEIGLQQGMKYL